MSSRNRRTRHTVARFISIARAVCSRVSPWSGHTQDDVLDGESDSLVRVPIGTSMDIDAKAKLHLLASFWKTSMGEVLDRLVTEACDKEAPTWPPKTASRRMSKYARQEWQALSRRWDRSEKRKEADLHEKIQRFSELERKLKSPSQAERKAASVDLLRLVKEIEDDGHRRPRRPRHF